MLNHVCIMGRLTRDPELRYNSSNTAVATTRIACERDFPSAKTGEHETDFLDLVMWRGTAEFVHRHFKKGDMIIVVGRLQTREWDEKSTGRHRTRVEIIVSDAYFGMPKQRELEADKANNPYLKIPFPGLDMDPDDGVES